MKLKFQGSPYQSLRRTLLWGEKASRNFSLNISVGHARNSPNYVLYESHMDQPLPLERISRGPDGRFVVQSEDESREHQAPFSHLESCEEPPEPYLHDFSPPEEPAWHRNVHLRPKNLGSSQQEGKASGHRHGRYFDYSSSSNLTEEVEPLRAINLGPVDTMPYGAILDTQWLAEPAASSLSSSPCPTPNSSPPSPRIQSNMDNSAQIGILQYLSLPFFREMNVDGDWPPEDDEKEDGPSAEPGFLDSPKRLSVPDQDEAAGPIYMDMELDSKAIQDQLVGTSFLQLPDPDVGPAKTSLPGSLACPLYPCSGAESPPPKEQEWLWTRPSSSSSSQPLPDCPQTQFSSLALPSSELPPESLPSEKYKSPVANFPQVPPLEKFLRGSLTSQSSGRGSASFLQPPSLAPSVTGSCLSSPFGDATSWQSSPVGEENRSKKENLLAALEKR